MNAPEIAYLGPVATFTHQAAWRAFGQEARYLPSEAIADVFAAVEEGKVRHGVVPVENSTEGVITSTLDLLVDSPLAIAGEITLPIRLFLLSREAHLTDVKHVYSHPSALAQCREWLRRSLPGRLLVETKSTAEAAFHCLSEAGASAVAGELVGRLYGLRALAEDIGDIPENYTRFLVLSRGEAALPGEGPFKTSLVISIKDRPGALYEMLRPFAEANLNMNRIESRPSKKRAWDYLFFIDFVGRRDDPEVMMTLARLREISLFLKVLGSYQEIPGTGG